MKKSYDKFFAVSITIPSVLAGMSIVGGIPGLLVGGAVSGGIILADKYLLNNKISETRLNNLFPKKPKM
jgi:hypothetical protein